VRPPSPPHGPATTRSITVLSPNEWAVYDQTGAYYPDNPKVVTITWKSAGVSGNVNIDISRNRLTNISPRKWERILGNVPNTGRAEWTPSGPATAFARVRVQSADNTGVVGMNAHDFCIYGPYYRGLPGGYCTEHAAREFDKVSVTKANWALGNAEQWYDSAATNNWDVTTELTKAVPGAIMVWAYGKYGHVAVWRDDKRDSDGNITAIVVDEENFGKFIVDPTTGKQVTDPITDHFGLVTDTQLPITNIDRKPLKFKGLILPAKGN
jgi:surface antigen